MTSRENLYSGVCEQRRRRPVCASAQSDQHLCYALIRKNHILTCYEQNCISLASICSRGDWFKSRCVGNPKDRLCRVGTHLIQWATIGPPARLGPIVDQNCMMAGTSYSLESKVYFVNVYACMSLNRLFSDTIYQLMWDTKKSENILIPRPRRGPTLDTNKF